MARIERTAHMTFGEGEVDPTLLWEAREKGYRQIGISIGDWYGGDLEVVRRVAKESAQLGLQVSVLTGYQRYANHALEDHPEWRMVFEDGSIGGEACPFWREYQARYVAAMRQVAAMPGVAEIQLNDEAHLTDWGAHWGCYCARCTALFAGETGQAPPKRVDWENPLWRRWVTWRFENWARVHREIVDAIRETAPNVLLSTQFDPSVCLRGWAPWFSGVDILALAGIMDLLRVDPYHTFHRHDFRPDTTYITENIRYLEGALGDKPMRIWTQGMTWPRFSRPLTEADGTWTAVLPLALGADATTYWAYPLLQETPEVMRAYESAFRLDPYYERTRPLRHAAVIQGWQSKVWLHNETRDGRAAYDMDWFRPACAALRQEHVPYAHLWDRRLAGEGLRGWRALLLPRVSCLSEAQGEALRGFAGGIVATSDTGCYDEQGRPAAVGALAPRVQVSGEWRAFGGIAARRPDHPVLAALPEAILPVWGRAPVVQVGAGVEVLATLLDPGGADTGRPAIAAWEEGGQRGVYLACEPWRLRAAGALRRQIGEIGDALLADAVRWAGGAPPASIVEPAPRGVELILGQGEDLLLVTLANHFLERDEIVLRVEVPAGKRLALAYDAVSRQRCAVEGQEGVARARVPLEGKAIKLVALHFA